MVSATIPLVSSKLEVAVLGARGERYVLRTWVPGFLGFLNLWGRRLILDAVHRTYSGGPSVASGQSARLKLHLF